MPLLKIYDLLRWPWHNWVCPLKVKDLFNENDQGSKTVYIKNKTIKHEILKGEISLKSLLTLTARFFKWTINWGKC